MHPARRLAMLALAALAAGGCTYAQHRWNDFADMGSVSVGMGAEASFKLGEALHLGLGSSISTETCPLFLPIPALYQLVYGPTCLTTEHWFPLSLFVGVRYDVPAVAHCIKWSSIYPYGPVPTDESRRMNPQLSEWVGAPPQHRCFLVAPFEINRDPVATDPRHTMDLEVSLFLLFGGKLRFRPVEFIDFLTGFMPGVDFMGDDPMVDRVPWGPYWYKTPPLTGEGETRPPEVPAQPQPPQQPPFVPPMRR